MWTSSEHLASSGRTSTPQRTAGRAELMTGGRVGFVSARFERLDLGCISVDFCEKITDFLYMGGEMIFLLLRLFIGCDTQKVTTTELTEEQKKLCVQSIKDFERTQISKIQKCLLRNLRRCKNLGVFFIFSQVFCQNC